MDISPLCVLYNGENKFHEHLFFYCLVSEGIWASVLANFGVRWSPILEFSSQLDYAVGEGLILGSHSSQTDFCRKSLLGIRPNEQTDNMQK